MRFASLGSGSEGNALAVELPSGGERSGGVRSSGAGHGGAGSSRDFLLIDCGFGRKEVELRLARLGLEMAGLRAILVTHEHSDHIGGVFRLAAAEGVPIYLTWGTREAARRLPAFSEAACRILTPDRPFELFGIGVTPFSVPHDAREPVQYVFEDGAARLGLLTDIGRSTPHVVAALAGLSALILECNHDRSMLAAGNYPAALKRRIGGDYGHLENAAAAALLALLDRSRLRTVVAAHLSRQNNRPELARQALASVLSCRQDSIGLADQDLGSGWFEA